MDNEKDIELYAADGGEDNVLLGSRDSGELTKRSVYKVRDAETGRYDRVHFETDSKMVWDATYSPRADMIARRDNNGSIEFYDIKATRNLNVDGNTAINGTAAVTGTSTFTGKVTADGSVDISNGLAVKTGGTTLASTLTVGGTSNFNNDVNINNAKTLTLNGGSKIALTDGSKITHDNKDAITFEKDINNAGSAMTIGAGGRTVIGGGESAQSFVTNSGVNLTYEGLYMTSDQHAKVVTNLQGGWTTRKEVEFTTSGGVTADGTLNTKQNLVVATTGTIGTNLTVNGTTTLKGNVSLEKDLSVGGKATITGGADISTSLRVLNASATVGLDASVGRNLSVSGTSTLGGNVTANANINLPNGNINIKQGEIRTGTSPNTKSLVIAAEDEALYLRASKTDSTNSGEIIVSKAKVDVSKPLNVTGAIDATLNVSGANVVAKDGQLRVTQNARLTTLGSDTDSTFNINTAASTVRTNKPVIVSGNITASNGSLIAGTTINAPGGFRIERALVSGVTSPGFYTTDPSIFVQKPFRMSAGTAVSANLNADKVDNCDVNDTLISTTNLWTANKINATKADKSINIAAGEGLTGGGTLSGNRTISHAAAGPTVASMGITRLTEVIKTVHLDKFGHIARIETYDMDKTFATPDFVIEQIANSNTEVDGSYIAHSRKNPSTGVFEKTKNAVNYIPMANYEINYAATGGGCIQFIFS